jgi:hypothetical protein
VEEKVIKLMTYFGLLFIIVYAVASAVGKRGQVSAPKSCDSNWKKWEKGSMWAAKSVPATSTQRYGATVPPVPQWMPN